MYYEEMQGIADGSGRDLLDIVALNVRTEINFGLFSDGCTSVAWHTEKRAWLAQNWDVRDRLSEKTEMDAECMFADFFSSG